MLLWHGELYLIDHGATLTFQHRWETAAAAVTRPYDAAEHALIGCEPLVDEADAELAALVTAGPGRAGGGRGARRLAAARAGLRLAAGAAPGLRGGDPRPPGGPPGVAARAARGGACAAWPAASPRRRGGPAWLPSPPPGGARMTGEAEVFEYAVLRVIPRVDRGEAMNAGVLLYCRPLRYLGARIALDAGLLLALDPAADVAGVRAGPGRGGGRVRRAPARMPARPAGQRGHRPPVPLADRAAQHGGPGGPGAHRADPRSGRGDRRLLRELVLRPR